MLLSAGNSWTLAEAAHLLNRAGFGGSPQEIRVLHRLGRSAAVDALLNPNESVAAFPVPDWATPARAAEDLKSLQAARKQLQNDIRALPEAEAEERKRVFNQKEQEVTQQHIQEAQHWWFRRMLLTRAPLREKLTLFWHDHFATSHQKVRQPVYLVWQNQRLREHSIGSFHELTTEMVRDPAMMLYLDSENSKKARPNENFARELMELFTLGVGHYQEADVRQAARAFTGYQINRSTGEVLLNRKLHDDREKSVLGQTGKWNAEEVVDIIFATPRPATFLATKLWDFFVGSPPPADTIQALAEILRSSRYQLRPALRRLFLSKEFYALKVMRNQIKSPVQFLVQLLRQLEISQPPEGFPMNGQQQLGQVLFMPPNVAGWNWGRAWINTNTLLARYNLADALTRQPKPNRQTKPKPNPAKPMAAAKVDFARLVPPPMRQNPEAIVDALVFRFFNASISKPLRALFLEFAETARERPMTDADVGDLCHLMLSTPDYQLT